MKSPKPAGRKPAVNKVGSIKQEHFIPATPDEVYQALMNAEIHAEFTGAGATCDPREGGAFTAHGDYITGKNVKLEKGKRIVQEWKTTEWPLGFKPSTLEITLKKKGDGTLLAMKQTNVPASQVSRYDSGWVEHYWIPLREYFEGK